jgi:hypothetical protein
MGYFDALTSSSFKTTADGRRLFFPWGIWGRGYAIPTEQDYERLRNLVKTYTIVSLVVVIGAIALFPVLWALGVAAVLIAFYLAWLPNLLRGLTPTDEQLSWQESITTQARTHNAWMLWLLLIFSLVLAVAAIVMFAADPRESWPVALPGAILFGAATAMFFRMLVLRRRTGSP